MEFSPSNNVVKLSLHGLSLEEKGDTEEAGRTFLQAWNEATSDFERFIASYHVARNQARTPDNLRWFETALHLAKLINDESVEAAFPFLHRRIAKCTACGSWHAGVAAKNDAFCDLSRARA
jgi:rifampin ADP-ribosylating transferase